MEETILQVKNLVKSFGKKELVFNAIDGVSFDVKKGEVVLIMGPSGSGKTTLMTMIGTLLKPTSGDIFINGAKITGLSERKLPVFRRKIISFVFQNFSLLESLSVKDNVRVALIISGQKNKDAEIKAIDILEKLGLGKRLNYLPSKLSGGEKQRVAVARALATDPLLILADEPTANLDSKNGHKIIEILRDAAKKRQKTVIIVSHDMRIIDIADRVIWLDDGKIKNDKEMDLATDPICKMKVKPETASYFLKVDGKIYYFCSKNCKDIFEKNTKK